MSLKQRYIMRVCKLQCNDLYEYIQKSKQENFLATVCSKEDAEFVADGDTQLYFKFCCYDDSTIKRIVGESKQWKLKYCITEHWDPSFENNKDKTQNEFYGEVKEEHILVRDGAFAGVVDYSKDLGNNYGLFFALISDYKGKPLQLCFWEGYGSSDKDMMYEKYSYLMKTT